jgi:hypothetical protein
VKPSRSTSRRSTESDQAHQGGNHVGLGVLPQGEASSKSSMMNLHPPFRSFISFTAPSHFVVRRRKFDLVANIHSTIARRARDSINTLTLTSPRF